MSGTSSLNEAMSSRASRPQGLTNAVVLLSGRVGTARTMDVRDLTRNGITYTAPVLYALDRSEVENCALANAYPLRVVYRYSWDSLQRRGRLARILCE